MDILSSEQLQQQRRQRQESSGNKNSNYSGSSGNSSSSGSRPILYDSIPTAAEQDQLKHLGRVLPSIDDRIRSNQASAKQAAGLDVTRINKDMTGQLQMT